MERGPLSRVRGFVLSVNKTATEAEDPRQVRREGYTLSQDGERRIVSRPHQAPYINSS